MDLLCLLGLKRKPPNLGGWPIKVAFTALGTQSEKEKMLDLPLNSSKSGPEFVETN